MKEFVFQKLDGQLRLLGPARKEYADWVATLDDKACFVAKYTAATSSKTHEQLGYLYAVVYPDVIAGLKELGWDEVGHKEFLGTRVPLVVNTENVDALLKAVYAISRGVEIPSKARMSKAVMSDFIETVLGWCRENGICIRPPLGDDYDDYTSGRERNNGTSRTHGRQRMTR